MLSVSVIIVVENFLTLFERQSLIFSLKNTELNDYLLSIKKSNLALEFIDVHFDMSLF